MANSRLCSIIDCGKPHLAKGFCKAHYQRLRNHGDPLGGGTSRREAESFYQDVVMLYDGDECLIWPYTRSNGYGQMWENGKMVTVSRLLCKDINGPAPTPKHEAAHSCGKGHEGCVTKRHLSWKTHSENCEDKIVHDTHNRGERHGRSKLSNPQAREILSLKGQETQKAIAVRYGVSRSTVAMIHNGKNWRWI